MIYQTRRGYFITALGIIFSMISIGIFILNYDTNWYYPTISYILITYILGLILLMGNAFGNVTLRLINSGSSAVITESKKQKYEYTDEEIARDIEEAVQKSLEKAADDIQFDLIDTRKLHVGNAAVDSETVVKVRDPIQETHSLNQTINPGEREEWGATGIDKVSDQLAAALQEPEYQRTSFFKTIKNFFKLK